VAIQATGYTCLSFACERGLQTDGTCFDSIVMRPRIKGEEAAGLQMPLLVKPISA
jgi:hypothetical protein